MAAPLTLDQRKQALASSGIGARFVHHRLSLVMPSALDMEAKTKEWITSNAHILIVSPSDEAALVFSGCVLFRKNTVYAVDTAILMQALKTNARGILDAVFEASVITLLGFYSSWWKKCPFSEEDIRHLEGFISMLVNEYDKNLIMRVTDESLAWYSEDFKQLVISNAVVVK